MRLVDYKEEELYRGTTFRFHATYSFEEIVEFMLINYPNSESGYAIICISGYCAGHVERVLPKEALCKNGVNVSTRWLVNNWNKEITPNTIVEEIYLIEKTTPSCLID